MDGELLATELISSVTTTAQRNELLNQIDILISNAEQKDIDELTHLGEVVKQQASKHPDREKYLQSVRKELLELPVVELIIAVVPNRRETSEIVSFVRSELSPKAIINIEVNPWILGGAIISYQGKYYDGSLTGKIQT